MIFSSLGDLCTNPVSTGCTCSQGYSPAPGGVDECLLTNIMAAINSNPYQAGNAGVNYLPPVVTPPPSVPISNPLPEVVAPIISAPILTQGNCGTEPINTSPSYGSWLACMTTQVAMPAPNLTPAPLPSVVQAGQVSTTGGTITTTPIASENWFTESLFFGIPNWMLLGGAGLIFAFKEF